MRKFYLAALLCLFTLMVSARPGGTVDVKISDEQQKPLEGIFVQLMNSKDSAMVQYTLSDKNGATEFTNIKQGNYFVYISQTGYQNFFSQSFTIDDFHLTANLEPIVLKTKSLAEVTVVSKVPAIEHYADKTVVNVQNSPLNAMGTVFDVIQRSPGVMVDNNDNISLQGKQGILVMIDGRVTPMTGTDLANLLKSMPAESVDKIEFITNPSAKYDANGSAGIINIILKKDKRIGANATVYGGYSQGIYPKTNDGFSFNDRTKKFNIFGSYNYSYHGSTNLISFLTNFYNGSKFLSSTSQNENLKTPSIDNIARLGTDFFATDKTTIGFIADASISKFLPSETTTTNVYDSLNNLQSYNVTNSNSPSTTYNFAFNLNLKHVFDSVGRELLVNADYAPFRTSSYQNIATNYYDNYGDALGVSNLYGSLPSNLNIYSLKADYDGKLGKKGVLGAGLKSSYVTTDNNVMIYDGTNSSAPVDTGQSNHFIYSENINAAYVTYGRDMGKANIQLGLRAEQTVTSGNQITTGQTFARNFLQLFPNFSINDSLGKHNQIGLSLSRRIDRPTYNQLNPFSLYINPTFYLNGNPYLLPQNAYLAELSDAMYEKYFITFTYTHTQYPITTVIEPFEGRPNIVKQTEENLNSSDNYALNFSVACQVTGWWTTTTSADAMISHYSADLANSQLSTYRFLYDGNTSNNFTISKKISADIDGFFYSGFDLGYLFLKPMGGLSAGIQFKVLKSKGTIKINATDILWTQTTNGTTYFTGFNETVFVRRDTRNVGVSFTYHFGGSSQSSLRSKGGAEDEKKRANSKTG
jgi:hypothetical protein